MKSIDNIWKEFGQNIDKLHINYDSDKSAWVITYDVPIIGSHNEYDSDMETAALNMLKWYNQLHSKKTVAETLWMALNNISQKLESTNEADCSAKYYSNMASVFEECLNLCEIRKEFMSLVDDKIVWNDIYDKEPAEEPFKETVKIKPEPLNNTIRPQLKKEIATNELLKNVNVPNDGFPKFFMSVNNSLSYIECWGYDINGNRTHILLDNKNQKNCKIDSNTSKLNDNLNYVEISELEYNDYYDQSASLLNAISMGYGIEDVSKYEIIPE